MTPRYIGGPLHGQAVPDVDHHRYAIVIDIVRYIRHGEHFVIFGMTPANAAILIGELGL